MYSQCDYLYMCQILQIPHEQFMLSGFTCTEELSWLLWQLWESNIFQIVMLLKKTSA